MRKIAVFLVVMLLAFINVYAAGLNADFYWEPQTPTDMQEVHFYDNSTGDIIAWIWYFGDGSSSTEQNPIHVYEDNGTYTVRLVIISSSGATDYVEKVITVLNIPPVADAGEDIISNNLTVLFNGSLSYDVDGSIVAWHWEFGDGNTADGETVSHTYEEEGIYVVNLTVEDNDGDSSNDSIEVMVDITPPVTNYTIENEKAWYNGNVTVSLEATDNLAGVNYTMYRIDNGSWEKYEENFTVSGEGVHKVYFYSVDNAGNVEKEKNVTIGIDLTPPVTNYTINATYGQNKWIKDYAIISFDATDNLAGINRTMYKIDDGDWEEYTEPINFSVKGEHVIYFYSIDNAGNVEEEKNFTIKIDKDAPTMSITAPKQGYIYIAGRRIMPTLFKNTFIIGKMTASVDANDATSGIYYVEFVLNGEVLWRDYVAPYEAELPREFPLSFNKLKIITYDMAGHYVESEEISYIKIL
ncbi:MAG: PKD domain-containing protein [Thermoplasmata archaeon]|nr:PKD domain-containing protein [Thermoplasmata archaeon]